MRWQSILAIVGALLVAASMVGYFMDVYPFHLHPDYTKASLVNEFMKEVRYDGLAEYGLKSVSDALESRRITKLLISEDKFTEYKTIVDTANEAKIPVSAISSDTVEGNQFLQMFHGLGAFTKYKIS